MCPACLVLKLSLRIKTNSLSYAYLELELELWVKNLLSSAHLGLELLTYMFEVFIRNENQSAFLYLGSELVSYLLIGSWKSECSCSLLILLKVIVINLTLRSEHLGLDLKLRIKTIKLVVLCTIKDRAWIKNKKKLFYSAHLDLELKFRIKMKNLRSEHLGLEIVTYFFFWFSYQT